MSSDSIQTASETKYMLVVLTSDEVDSSIESDLSCSSIPLVSLAWK